ncbi:hypothetical protein, partial [Streptococcus dysgalactiae]|uniref:hypothetical protein n=1 Tax=Streptococcus dysgalactiae TaxID=1334 RepID=UPI001950D158
NLPAKAVVGSTSLNLTEGLNAKQDHANHVDFHASDSLLERLFTKLELPRCKMPFFDGSTVRYVMFFRQFEDQIARHVSDDGQRLTYLYHYCTGTAKEAIGGCLMYPPDRGNIKACEILHDLFGQPHLIVRAMLDKVTCFSLINADANNLSNYAYKLSNCA